MSRVFAGRVMKTGLLACLASLGIAAGALAAAYPPGPGNAYPDTLNIINVQNPAAVPHPGNGDVVLGIGGIITGFVDQARPFGLYIQLSNGGQWSGVGVYSGNVFHGPGSDDNYQLGDSVVVYGKVKSYQQAVAIGSIGGNNEITALSFESSLTAEDLTIRRVSSGNALPAFHVGPISELEMTGTNPAGRPWEGTLVRVNGPLKVVAIEQNQDPDLITLDNNPGFERFLILQDANCAANCQLVKVDCSSLVDFVPPPVGSVVGFVQGVFDRRQSDHLIQLRNASDLGLGNAPVAQDAFPIYDNDLAGASRIDSVMVVFDVAVDATTANNAANYTLGSGGTVDGAQRLAAPNDNRVVLKIRNGLDDGATESITVKNVKSLSDGTAMFSPQTFSFLNGVIELDKVRQPDAAALAGNPCDDRSRYSGAGSNPGLRGSWTGTVTGKFGDWYTLQGTTLTRGGLWVYSPGFALTVGNGAMLAGAFHETAGETQGGGLVYARDLGAAAAAIPQVQSVGTLLDETCDAAQLFLTGLDLDGMLVTLDRVVVTQVNGNGSFYVATPNSEAALAAVRGRVATPSSIATPSQQILVAVLGGNFATAPVVGRIVTITGALGVESDAFAVFPRNQSDVVDYGDVPTFTIPLNVSKSATLSRDPDIVKGVNGELFMSWGRVFHESVHSLSLDLTQNWSLPTSIMHQGVQPALAVTPSNKFCAITSTPNELVFKQSTDGGHEMDAPVTTVDSYPTSYPGLTVGQGEHLHATWERQNNGVFYARSLDGGATFSEPVQVSTTVPSESNHLPRIGASTGDNVFVFWDNHQPGEPGVDRVLYSRSLDGGTTFSTPRQLRDETNPLTSVIKIKQLGDTQVGVDGTVWVMGVEQGSDTKVALLKSTNSGFTFKLVSELPLLPSTDGSTCAKSFCLGPDGQVHALIAKCGTALYYTRSTDAGLTWTTPVDVSSLRSVNVGEPRGAKIILDGTGTPVIVWYSEVGGSTEIFSARLLN